MADYDKLIKTLRICGSLSSCEGCPRFKSDELGCYIQVKQEAADAIEELSKELMDLKLLTCSCCEVQEENGT